MRKSKRRTKKEIERDRKKEDVQDEDSTSIGKGIMSAILFFGIVVFILSFLSKAGTVGEFILDQSNILTGSGIFFVPVLTLLLAISFIKPIGGNRSKIILLSISLFFAGFLGFLSTISLGSGGSIGDFLFSTFETMLGGIGSFVLSLVMMAIAFSVAFRISLLDIMNKIRGDDKEKAKDTPQEEYDYDADSEEQDKDEGEENKEEEEEEENLPTTVLASSSSVAESVDISIDNGGATVVDSQTLDIAGMDTNFRLPPFSLLEEEGSKAKSGNIEENAKVIQRTLETFGISVEMGDAKVGPTVTQYTIKPADGIRLSKITALTNDIALALAAKSIRIEAPIPGKSLVGLEIPNQQSALVRLRPLLENQKFQKAGDLAIAIGRDVSGEPIYSDLTKMPHLLIAGSTGSGKTIAVTSIIMSLLYSNTPQQLRLVLIDPKRVEFSVYANLPHLLSPVVTESAKAINALKWAITEMDRRFDIFSRVGVRDIVSYHKNKKALEKEGNIPYLVIIIDEFADLMAVKGREVEGLVVRIAQLARAAGIHLIIATQRPSVEVITGTIKANLPSRMSFSVASHIDSRTILDSAGAEKLLGKGDMLFIPPQSSTPIRIQGAFIQDTEVKKVSDFIRAQNSTQNETQEKQEEVKDILDLNNNKQSDSVNFDDYGSGGIGNDPSQDDALYNEAKNVVIQNKKASASLLQRRLRVGYARAARLIDLLEENNVIGPPDGARAREVYILSEEEQYGGPVAKDQDNTDEQDINKE